VNLTLQRTNGLLRGTLRRSERLRRRVTDSGTGLLNAAARQMSPGAKPELDDIKLTRRLETEILASHAALQGVEVNAVDGVVYVRGEVERPAQIEQLEARTRAIPGVRDVENLLHLAKPAARIAADPPGRTPLTRSPTPRPSARARGTANATGANATAGQGARRAAPALRLAEPPPGEVAATGTVGPIPPGSPREGDGGAS
jgi:hypothetical protein